MFLTGLKRTLVGIAVLLGCFAAWVYPASLQDSPPDYSIQLIQNSFTADNRETIVKFDVLNSGGAAAEESTATLNLISTGEEIATATIPPLVTNGRFTVVMQFPNDRFGPNSVESFRAAIGIDEIEQSGTPSIQDNFARIVISFPANLPQPETTPTVEPSGGSTGSPDVSDSNLINQLLTQLNIDPSKPEQLAVLGGVIIALIVLLLLLYTILRLLFTRKPDFGGWQPSYANMPMVDPNSLQGRHQQWQTVAQNSVLPLEGAEGGLHVRKLVTGVNDQYLSGWHVVAFQISQYDKYGRISRTQIISTPRLVKRLEWVVRRVEKLSPEKRTRNLRPIAQALSHQVRKKVNERTAVLPLAMDIRLRARHGEVHIWFELFRRQYAQWLRIDRWEPEMMVTGKMIYENFTFTLYGQKPGETLKQFQKRLEEDVIVVLNDFLNPATPTAAQRPDAPTDPHMMPVSIPPEN